MTLTQLQQQIMVMARPGGATSTVIQQNSQTWINEFVCRELYKLRRWWFLHQAVTLVTRPGDANFPAPFPTGEALYIVSATSDGQDLLLPPLAQAKAFYADTGPPEAVALGVPGLGWKPGTTAHVSDLMVFPTPDGEYRLDVAFTSPLAPLAYGTDHNFLTDQFPFLVIAGGLAIAFLSLQEDQLFTQWWQIYANQCRALASYDHEVRRGGTMPEPIEPFLPPFALGAAPQPVAAAG